ncbi:hypothetical protein BDP55DRAFT_104417 [Colletotrichum godetiae]|uniref:Uncharacterized protein n=1 Tax=Colletotrichum godetiae TaxID=1209918 RepID=A0AAJ0AM46_9PEZI|nr:uncharacterized protein BDP55DRAFT_104417 [Colletotrichum godetiae]KAK1676428.1 hypothetical protein BDP55DRAFT_104417 [Colletotrichum godetiae]
MSAEGHGQGSRDQLWPSTVASEHSNAHFQEFLVSGEDTTADHTTELGETLKDLHSRIQSAHPQEPPTASHDPHHGASTAHPSTQAEWSGTSRRSPTTPPTEISDSQARHGALSTGHLTCPFVGKFGSGTMQSCQKHDFKNPSDLKLHLWRFHVHTDDQEVIHNTGTKPLTLYQAAQTTKFLNKFPLYRLRAEHWGGTVAILSPLNKWRPRSSERLERRSECNSKVEKLLFPNRDIELESHCKLDDTRAPIHLGFEEDTTSFLSEPGETDLQPSNDENHSHLHHPTIDEDSPGKMLSAIGSGFKDSDDVQLADFDRLFAEMEEAHGKVTSVL